MTGEFRRAIQHEVSSWVGASVFFTERRKHSAASLVFQEQARMVVVARSASDTRALRNVISEVRRALRALGAIRSEQL
jgi:hypothetical protein